MWLDDNVIRAAWSPDGEKVTTAVYNPQTEQVDLVFVTGPDQVEVISDCASNLFSWSPDGQRTGICQCRIMGRCKTILRWNLPGFVSKRHISTRAGSAESL